jgi:hypothetical protein
MFGHRNTAVASPVALLQTGVCNLERDEPVEDAEDRPVDRPDSDDRAEQDAAGSGSDDDDRPSSQE